MRITVVTFRRLFISGRNAYYRGNIQTFEDLEKEQTFSSPLDSSESEDDEQDKGEKERVRLRKKKLLFLWPENTKNQFFKIFFYLYNSTLKKFSRFENIFYDLI